MQLNVTHSAPDVPTRADCLPVHAILHNQAARSSSARPHHCSLIIRWLAQGVWYAQAVSHGPTRVMAAVKAVARP